MKSRGIAAIVIFWIAIGCVEPGQAAQLGEYRIVDSFGSWGTATGKLIKFGSVVDSPETPGSWIDYLSWEITPDDVGKTFVASTLTDPEFDNLVFTLTNGTNNSLGFSHYNTPVGGGSSIGFMESDFVKYGLEGVGFFGCSIDNIALAVNNFTLSHGNNWTDSAIDVTVSINGIPEPATVSLLAFGGLALRRRKR